MRCPRCAVELERVEEGFDGACVIDRCPSCEGCWLDPGELDELDQSVWTNVEKIPMHDEARSEEEEEEEGTAGYRDPATQSPISELEERIDCPRCAPEMPLLLRRVLFQGLETPVIDRCDRCGGLWLDGAELESVRELASRIDTELLSDVRWKPGASADDPAATRKRSRR